MIRRPPRSTRTDTLFPTRRSSDLRHRCDIGLIGSKRGQVGDPRAGDAKRDEQERYDAAGRGQSCADQRAHGSPACRSEEHTSELQSLMRISYAVFCLKKKKKKTSNNYIYNIIT